ncbi:Uma2 family endonuclease [Amycolatopsis pithecellobii]|nr:Uma2 family endonuclease [Amycolatopsis pithecellobii]
MTAQLAHEERRTLLGPVTVDDWLAADAPADGSRLELILGYFAMSPPPTGFHQDVTAELTGLLRAALRAAGRSDLRGLPGVGVRISTPLRIALIPDLVVVNVGVRRATFEADNLLLAVEVWSPGNRRAERETKIGAYAQAGVPFLWLVETPLGEPVKFRGYRLEGVEYVLKVQAEAGETVTAPGPVPVKIDTSELG